MFRCKQFTVAQDKCAMKVNTDSLILGSWANIRADVKHAPRILDIGTGSGILALMMAQKAESQLVDIEFRIDAIEIDKDAAAQAVVNFKKSKWAEQLHIHSCDLADFKPAYLYDTIISNPPYFDTPAKVSNAYNKQSHNRSVARQTSTLSPDELFNASSALLIESGQMYCVYPASMEADIIKTAAGHGLLLEAMLYVKHTSDKDPYLCAFRFSKAMRNANDGHADCTAYADHLLFTTKVANENALIIRDREGYYTNEYKALCQPFYLKF